MYADTLFRRFMVVRYQSTYCKTYIFGNKKRGQNKKNRVLPRICNALHRLLAIKKKQERKEVAKYRPEMNINLKELNLF